MYGMFQSYKYFDDIKEVLKEEIQLKNHIKSDYELEIEKLINKSNSVSIHVRRGDYLNHPNLNICKESYYKNAIEYINQEQTDLHFFIFSNDIEYCKENFKMPNCHFIETARYKDNLLIDFNLMKQCKHQIIANSTYSWWAAYLKNHKEGIVISPTQWDKDNAKPIDDKIPPHWMKVPI